MTGVTLTAAQGVAPSPFVEGTMIPFAFDSTSLGTFMDCPRKFYYSQVRGLRRKWKAAPITFGSAFHKALETYELERGKGLTLDQALAPALHAAREDSVGMEEHKSRTPEALMRSVEAYIRHHEGEQMETLTTQEGKPAVELHFKASLGNAITFLPEQEVLYCGYIDRVVRFQGTPFVLDHKTTGMSISTEKGSASYFGAFTPDMQMTGYVWASREAYGFPVRGVIVDAMQVAKTKTEFARQIINRTPAQIDEWRAGVTYWVRLAATSGMVATQVGDNLGEQAKAYPMNQRHCHSRYGACTFAGVCGRDPSVREAFINTDFGVEPWNPLLPRQSGTLANESEEAASE